MGVKSKTYKLLKLQVFTLLIANNCDLNVWADMFGNRLIGFCFLPGNLIANGVFRTASRPH